VSTSEDLGLGAETVDTRNDQRRKALALANKRRSQLADLKKRIRKGEVSPYDVLEGKTDYEQVLKSLSMYTFLTCIPRFGHQTAIDICSEFGLLGTYKIGRLSPKRRLELAQMIRLIKGESDRKFNRFEAAT
jgi:hypothetical protein